ncbi:MAG: SDR family oxidoreductase [Rhodospirillales bacterium]|nr:SDR family oxidoreductase [Rhodospirillales bacterium]
MSDKSFRLDDRPAIVVGAALGIGRAIALAFAEAGAKVACLDIDEAAARGTAALVKGAAGAAMAHRCDVTSETSVADAVQAAIAAHGAPHVLVNGAAMREPTGTIVELAPADWNRAIAINLSGAYLVSRAVIPHMAKAGGGSIIHIASQMGRVGAAGRGVYCATKGALIQLAKVMAVDHARDNIRVNTLSPGAIETERVSFRYGSMADARAHSVPKHPIGRLGQAEEIARGALYLASDASSFMTGSDLLIDGGYTAV